MFSDIPRFVMVDLLREVVGNKTFQIVHDGQKGYIRYCNGYYLFQPNTYMDVTIPLSIRVGRFPVKRDAYYPMEYDVPEVDDEKIVVNTTGTVEGFWRAAVGWVDALVTDASEIPYPDEIQQRRFIMSRGDKDSENRYEQILEMIRWIHRAFHKSDKVDEGRNPFRMSLLFHFWDEWLRVDEQIALIYSPTLGTDPSVIECSQENQARIGRILVHRFYQPESDSALYLCEEGSECQSSIIDAVKRDQRDRMNSFTITQRTTGSLYGFLITKNGELIFKTGQPTLDGKIERGLECGNVSNKTGHIAKLISIGALLKQWGWGDMDLNRAVLLSDPERELRGTIRICTLMNLFLRFLDAIQLRQQVWFLRPLFAHLTGHVGFFRRGR